MPIYFTDEEYKSRVTRVREEMTSNGNDAMLIFAQESMYWLTGYDTFGYCFFQCLILTQDDMILLTRSADLRQAQQTSNIGDIRIWKDSATANPASDLKDILSELGLSGKKLGIELDTHGLTAANYRKITGQLDDFAELIDQSYVISELRLVKSDQEIEYAKRAGVLADDALDAAIAAIKSDGSEAAVLAAMHNVIFAQGGDYPGNEFIIGSGRDALLCRYKSGRRELSTDDQLTLEWAGSFAHYHAAMMRTIIIGKPRPLHGKLFEASQEALTAVVENMQTGRTFGDVFQAHADALDAHGFSNHRLNACGYSLGARYTPSWMEHQMFYENNPQEIKPGMTLFAHMIIVDSETETAMTLGQTFLTTDGKAENLSRNGFDLIQC
ncbi:MAG: aminopeptidase P family protein [Rhizobiaceae bacterium]|nr:aminopeptidase P family protein [Rhizobiaceae bacterium]